MPSLAELKAKSQQNLQKFKEKSKPGNQNERKSDERYWYPKRDEAGNALAIIRFLPVCKTDDSNPEALPWVKIYSHSFKHTNDKWYIENSLTTFGEKDPLGEYNSKLWEQGENSDGQKQAKHQKRKLNYTSNVYIVKDPANPENEGKVFLYRYGMKIFEKVNALMNPEEGLGDEPVDPFNFWTGRNFRLKIKTVKVGNAAMPNYDSSEWDSISQISNAKGKPLTDEQIEQVWEQSHSLLELLDRKHFKSYDELKKRMNAVFGFESEEEKPVERKSSMDKPATSQKQETKAVVDEDEEINSLLNSVDETTSDDTDDLINKWMDE
jgi:hypothetical protein